MRSHKTALIATISIALTGCSGLSRDSAAKQIANHIRVHSVLIGMDKTLTPLIGHIEATCFGAKLGIGSAYDPIEKDQRVLALSKAGFLAIKNGGEHKWDVSLTEEGQRAISDKPYGHEQAGDCDYWQVTFPTATLDSVKVTGIEEEGPHAKVEAVLVWKPTPVGFAVKRVLAQQQLPPEASEEILRDRNLARMSLGDRYFNTFETFRFEKYDDGWRIK